MEEEKKEILTAIYNQLTPDFWMEADLATVADDIEKLLAEAEGIVIFYSQSKKAFYRITADGSGGLKAEIAYF